MRRLARLEKKAAAGSVGDKDSLIAALREARERSLLAKPPSRKEMIDQLAALEQESEKVVGYELPLLTAMREAKIRSLRSRLSAGSDSGLD